MALVVRKDKALAEKSHLQLTAAAAHQPNLRLACASRETSRRAGAQFPQRARDVLLQVKISDLARRICLADTSCRLMMIDVG